MLTVTLSTIPGAASVRLTANGWHVATYPVTQDDGDGPVPAAETVLERHGWKVTAPWHHESSGISGDVWMAEAEQAQP